MKAVIISQQSEKSLLSAFCNISVTLRTVEEVGTQEATPGRESVKYTWNNQSSEDNMQLFDTKSLRLQLFEEVHALAAKTQHFMDMVIKFEIGIEENTKQLESINKFYMG